MEEDNDHIIVGSNDQADIATVEIAETVETEKQDNRIETQKESQNEIADINDVLTEKLNLTNDPKNPKIQTVEISKRPLRFEVCAQNVALKHNGIFVMVSHLYTFENN